MPPRKVSEAAAKTAHWKNLTMNTGLNEWVSFPTATEVYKNPTAIQRAQHRIKAHKYKLKHLESDRKSYLDRQKNIMKIVAKHGRGDPAALEAALENLSDKESNLIVQWERLHGRSFEMNFSKPKDPLEKRIAVAHRKYRQAMEKVRAARYKPGDSSLAKGLAKVNRAIAREKAAMAANTAKLNRARRAPAARAPAARAPAARATGNANTGKKDAKGRTIFKGPRGGLFVRVNGKKQKPAL